MNIYWLARAVEGQLTGINFTVKSLPQIRQDNEDGNYIDLLVRNHLSTRRSYGRNRRVTWSDRVVDGYWLKLFRKRWLNKYPHNHQSLIISVWKDSILKPEVVRATLKFGIQMLKVKYRRSKLSTRCQLNSPQPSCTAWIVALVARAMFIARNNLSKNEIIK